MKTKIKIKWLDFLICAVLSFVIAYYIDLSIIFGYLFSSHICRGDLYKDILFVLHISCFTIIIVHLFINYYSFRLISYLFIPVLFKSINKGLLSVTTNLYFYLTLVSQLIFVLVYCFLMDYINKKSLLGKKKDDLRSSPIESAKEDILSRALFVENLAKSIKDLKHLEPYVYSLRGSWGEGKTSILNLLQAEFQNDSEHITISFVPWGYSSKDALIKAFYMALYNSIKINFIFIEKFYLFLLISFYTNTLNLSFSGFSFDFIRHSEASFFKREIQKYINRNDKKIVFVIDEIDRLITTNEILLIFELMRNSASFYYMRFIITFDSDQLNALFEREKSPLDVEEYLEKIISKNILLPPIMQQDLTNFIFKKLEEIVNDKSVNMQMLQNIWSDKKIGVMFFNTLRKAKLFIREFNADFAIVRDDVDLLDFILLSVIRTSNLDLYKKIRTGGPHDPNYVKYIEAQFRQKKITSQQKLLYLDIINNFLFLKKNQYTHEKKLINPVYFDRYFPFWGHIDISDIVFGAMLKFFQGVKGNKDTTYIHTCIKSLHNQGRYDSFIELLYKRDKITMDNATTSIHIIIGALDHKDHNLDGNLIEQHNRLIKRCLDKNPNDFYFEDFFYSQKCESLSEENKNKCLALFSERYISNRLTLLPSEIEDHLKNNSLDSLLPDNSIVNLLAIDLLANILPKSFSVLFDKLLPFVRNFDAEIFYGKENYSVQLTDQNVLISLCNMKKQSKKIIPLLKKLSVNFRKDEGNEKTFLDLFDKLVSNHTSAYFMRQYLQVFYPNRIEIKRKQILKDEYLLIYIHVYVLKKYFNTLPESFSQYISEAAILSDDKYRRINLYIIWDLIAGKNISASEPLDYLKQGMLNPTVNKNNLIVILNVVIDGIQDMHKLCILLFRVINEGAELHKAISEIGFVVSDILNVRDRIGKRLYIEFIEKNHNIFNGNNRGTIRYILKMLALNNNDKYVASVENQYTRIDVIRKYVLALINDNNINFDKFLDCINLGTIEKPNFDIDSIKIFFGNFTNNNPKNDAFYSVLDQNTDRSNLASSLLETLKK